MYLLDGMTKDTTLTPKKGIGKERNRGGNSLEHRVIGCEVSICCTHFC